jgi:uncharacterized protein involved in exopolysaccharide biosynthesis
MLPALETPTRDEITLGDMITAIRRSRLVLLAFLLVGTGAGVCAGLLMSKQYEAVVVVSPVTDDGSGRLGGGLGALVSQYSGLASLAGVSLTAGNKRDETIAVLQSELLTEKYIRDHDLLPVLFPKDWDPALKSWKPLKKRDIPTLWKGNRYFGKNIRKVTDEKRTGLVYLKIKWKDADTAATWANDLIKLTNDYLREKAVKNSEANIQYLTEQAAKMDTVEAKKVIYTLMEDEINKAMYARGRQEYALKVIDPAFPPEKPSSWGPTALGIFGLIGSLFAFLIWIFTRRVLSNTTTH